MARIIFSVLLLLATVLCADAQTTTKSMRHRVLLITTTPSTAEDFLHVTNGLNGYGIPYDQLIIPNTGYNGSLPLQDSAGNPLYSLVIVTPGQLPYANAAGVWGSALTQVQWDQLAAYESKWKVRRVSLDDTPQASHGTVIADSTAWGCCGANVSQDLVVNLLPEMSKYGLVDNATFTTQGLYHYPVKITNTTTTQAFLKLKPSSDGLFKNETVGGVVDDLFLSTEIPAVDGTTYTYRITAADAQGIYLWQKAVTGRAPAGSQIKLMMAFNGQGVVEQIDENLCANVADNDITTDRSWMHPPGTGPSNWPQDLTGLKNYNHTWLSKEPLYKYLLGTTTMMKEFFWCSHTYTHETLDNCSRTDVDNELSYNIFFAQQSGLYDSAYFSKSAMVTPSISGLHNSDALNSLVAHGIKYVTGDTSRPDCTNTTYPYLPWVSTKAVSNYDGFIAIPRQPTVIYYLVTTPGENLKVYNDFYRNQSQATGQAWVDKTFDYIVDVDTSRAVSLFMSLRQDPYMFHQGVIGIKANLRNADQPVITLNGVSGRFGLLQYWTEVVVNKLTKLVKWPIISPHLDAHVKAFLDRAALRECGSSVSFGTNGTHFLSFTVKSTGTCKVPVTVPGAIVEACTAATCTLEKIGVDPLTVWVNMTAGVTRTFTLSPAYKL
ncbi:hypothetical protein HK104_002648 [Borealophlyctis nickersoniae]|nr:hypothetical protein HK104_002648 [Borealophlyctis nickersoniae]